jgi:hypothetical protein
VIAFMRWILESEETLSTTDENIQDSLQQIFNPSLFFPSRSNYIKFLRLELRAMADELKQKWLDEKEQKRLRRLDKKAKAAAALAQAASGGGGVQGGDVITPALEQSMSSSSTDDDDSEDNDDAVECLPGKNNTSSHHLNQSSINVDMTDDDHQYAYKMAAD